MQGGRKKTKIESSLENDKHTVKTAGRTRECIWANQTYKEVKKLYRDEKQLDYETSEKLDRHF